MTATQAPSAQTPAPRHPRELQVALTVGIVLFVLLTQNPGIIHNLGSSPVNVPITTGNPYTSLDLKTYVPAVGVPNYAAKIALQIENLRTSYGSSVRFHIEVTPAGTAQAQYVYYDLVLVSPGNQPYIVLPQNGGIPPSGWPFVGGLGYYIPPDIYIPFQTLSSGSGSYYKVNGNDYQHPTQNFASYIWLQWDIPSDLTQAKNYLGTWSVYVFAYAALAAPAQSPTNAISYATDNFQIVSMNVPAPSLWSLDNLFKGFSLLFAFAFAWFAVYPRVVRHWGRVTQIRRNFVAIMIFLLFISAWVAWLFSR